MIDQRAKLYRVYTQARELLHGPMTADSLTEMWRLRGELRELRSVWRQEATRKVSRIEDPNSASLLRRKLMSRHRIAERIGAQMGDVTGELQLVEYSMRLEYVLGIAAGSLDEFQRCEEEDLRQMNELRVLMQQKANWIDDSLRGVSAQPLVDTVSDVVAAYGELLSSSVSDATTAVS